MNPNCPTCGGEGWYAPVAIPFALVNCECNPTWEGADWPDDDEEPAP